MDSLDSMKVMGVAHSVADDKQSPSDAGATSNLMADAGAQPPSNATNTTSTQAFPSSMKDSYLGGARANSVSLSGARAPTPPAAQSPSVGVSSVAQRREPSAAPVARPPTSGAADADSLSNAGGGAEDGKPSPVCLFPPNVGGGPRLRHIRRAQPLRLLQHRRLLFLCNLNLTRGVGLGLRHIRRAQPLRLLYLRKLNQTRGGWLRVGHLRWTQPLPLLFLRNLSKRRNLRATTFRNMTSTPLPWGGKGFIEMRR